MISCDIFQAVVVESFGLNNNSATTFLGVLDRQSKIADISGITREGSNYLLNVHMTS